MCAELTGGGRQGRQKTRDRQTETHTKRDIHTVRERRRQNNTGKVRSVPTIVVHGTEGGGETEQRLRKKKEREKSSICWTFYTVRMTSNTLYVVLIDLTS